MLSSTISTGSGGAALSRLMTSFKAVKTSKNIDLHSWGDLTFGQEAE